MTAINKRPIIVEIREDEVGKKADFIAECKSAFHRGNTITYNNAEYFVAAYDYFIPESLVAYRITLTRINYDGK